MTDAEKIAALRRALAEWKCPACGGSGIYKEKWTKRHPEGWEGSCTKCEGHGLHPTARAALEGIEA